MTSLEVVIERDVPCHLADGTVLRADIHRPSNRDRYPVLLCRTPYDKSAPLNRDVAAGLAARGYIAVSQDIRGSHRSDGELVWQFSHGAFAREAADGAEAVAWAATLPGSDGQVGTFGVSYSSWLAWCLAHERPPALRAMAVSGITQSIRDMNFGIFEPGRRLQWTYAQAAGLRSRAGDQRYPATLADANADWLGNLRGKWLWHLPLKAIPDHVFGQLAEDLRTYMDRQHEEFWPLALAHPRISAPVCVQTGWWDRFSLSVSHYRGLVEHGPAELAGKHRLVVGPWGHHPLQYRRDIGPVDYGPDASRSYVDFLCGWYDHHFKGEETEIACGPPVQLFIVNRNRWQGFSTWPPPAMRETPLFLSSAGNAGTPAGDGMLLAVPPADEPPDHYLYDPADPVMSLMGADSQMLPVDQRANDRRTDILVYQTPSLARPLLLVGPVRLELWAASDGPDTDFAARLIEVRPDGLAINIASGIVRARWREGYDRPLPLEPGRPTLFSITLLPVGIEIGRGSRLRLDVTSSDFPAFDRNHNTGGDDYAETRLRVARQSVFHDAQRPSRLVLPVLGEGSEYS